MRARIAPATGGHHGLRTERAGAEVGGIACDQARCVFESIHLAVIGRPLTG